MTRKKIEDVIVICLQNLVPDGDVKNDTRLFHEGLELSSFDIVTFVIELEEKLDFYFPDDWMTFADISTVDDLAVKINNFKNRKENTHG